MYFDFQLGKVDWGELDDCWAERFLSLGDWVIGCLVTSAILNYVLGNSFVEAFWK